MEFNKDCVFGIWINILKKQEHLYLVNAINAMHVNRCENSYTNIFWFDKFKLASDFVSYQSTEVV